MILANIGGRLQVAAHRRIGVKPGWTPICTNYGAGMVLGLRMWWSAITVTWLRKPAPAGA